MIEEVLAQLNLLAFEKVNETQFRALSSCPEWFNALYKNALREHHEFDGVTYELVEAFPFVEFYLIDAQLFWNGSTDHMTRSEIWTEENNNQVYRLELEALKLSTGEDVLLIHDCSALYEKHEQVYQKARDIALSNERLLIEINKQQRSLHSEISKRAQSGSVSDIIDSMNEREDPILFCDRDGRVVRFNKSFSALYFSEKSELESSSNMIQFWVDEAQSIYPEMQRFLNQAKSWEGEFDSMINGESTSIRLSVSPVDHEGEPHLVCVVNRLVSDEISELGFELDKNIDRLTKLPNRRAFWTILDRCIKASINDKEDFAFIYLDLDRFKDVNLEFGHKAGDFLLSVVSLRLTKMVYQSDYVVHLGGDKFGIIMKPVFHQFDINSLVDRLRKGIAKPICLDDGRPVAINSIVGVCRFPLEGEQIENSSVVFNNANWALETAKKANKDYEIYNPLITDSVPDMFKKEQDIQRGIKNKEFVLHYQPQFSFLKKEKHIAEALVRWNHPEDGLLSPFFFIELAETSGLIIELGEWIFEEAFKQAAELHDMNLNVKIAVNVSTKQFMDDNFLPHLHQLLQTYPGLAHYIELEITESSFLENPDEVIAMLEQLKLIGFSISLDDFGTGYSSLSYLQRLPVDKLKIDREFIIGLPDHLSSKIIVSSVIKLAHKMDMVVTAEGVETQQQLDYLEKKKCDLIQGYIKSRPIPRDELIRYFEDREGVAHEFKRR